MKLRSLFYSCAVLALVGGAEVGQAQGGEVEAMQSVVRMALGKVSSPRVAARLKRLLEEFKGNPSQENLERFRRTLLRAAKAYSQAAFELAELHNVMQGSSGAQASSAGEGVVGVKGVIGAGAITPSNQVVNPNLTSLPNNGRPQIRPRELGKPKVTAPTSNEGNGTGNNAG